MADSGDEGKLNYEHSFHALTGKPILITVIQCLDNTAAVFRLARRASARGHVRGGGQVETSSHAHQNRALS